MWPAMPLHGVIIALMLIGFGAGTVYPVATVSIQNAVPAHQVGTATGAMNFFRALASTLAVAIMGTILLAGLGATPERGTGGSAAHGRASTAGPRAQCGAGVPASAARASGIDSFVLSACNVERAANRYRRYLVRTVSS